MTEPGAVPRFPLPRVRPFDPPPQYDEFRERCPVTKVTLYDDTEAWLVTRYDDVRTVLGDDRFSAVGSWRFQPSASRAAAERGEKSFTAMDPPEHRHFRRMLTRHFTVKRIEQLRPAVESIVDDVLSQLVSGPRPVDLVQALALPVASRTMCHLVGVPYQDHAWYEKRATVRSVLDADPAEAAQATQDLLDYVDRLVTRRQAEPGEDLTSRLVQELLVTGLIHRSDLVAMLRLLLTAGHETTATMIGTGTFVLLQHPDQLRQLVDDADLLPNAIEELLRYISMLHLTIVRVAKDAVELGGQQIVPGDGLIATPAAANKDPHAFPDPNRFDIHREARHHIAFGYGVHQCLGQPVARLELQSVFSALFARLPGLRLAIPADEVQYNHSNLVGVQSLPVNW
ncbi:MAG: cytochrome P450 [Propionibacteriales bacterium]|nr:cytochrome P450 [Propionibacteriales bacterium]